MRALIIICISLFIFGACESAGGTDHGTHVSQTDSSQDQPAATSNKPQRLGPGDFLAKLQATPGAQLIDVRTPGEVALGMIPECTNFDFSAPDFQEKIAGLDKEK
ncbi:MAG: rhodanese-like domain-containing protein, partial [Bacteroidota bacterium]